MTVPGEEPQGQILDEGAGDTGVGEGDGGGGEVSGEIPADLQALGVTDPQQYERMKAHGITSAKELELFNKGRTAGYDYALEEVKKKPTPAPDPKPEKKVDTADYMGQLKGSLRQALGGKFRELERDVKAGKISEADLFEAAITMASEETYAKLLSDTAYMTQSLNEQTKAELQVAYDEIKANDFFASFPQYKEFEKGIRRQVDAGIPIEEVLEDYNQILAARGNGRRHATRDDVETAQLRKARASVEGFSETPTPRGGATSGPADRQSLDKFMNDIVETRRKHGSESPEYRRALNKWTKARASAG